MPLLLAIFLIHPPSGRMANTLKNQEHPKYAAMCFSAMARYYKVYVLMSVTYHVM